MKKVYKLLIATAIIIGFSKINFAQDITLFNMHNLHQSINNNPANQIKSKVYIGLPVITNVYFDFTNTGFTYKNIFSEIQNAPDTAKYLLDIDKFYEELDDVNYLNLETQFSVLNLGFWIKKYYFSLGSNIKYYQRFAFPRSILDIRNGNYNVNENPISFSNIGIDLTAYNEIYFGASTEIIPNLTVGAKVKLLYGIANFSTEKFTVDWTTDSDPQGNFAYTFNTEFEFRTSLPIEWNPTYDSVTNLPNGFEYDETFLDGVENDPVNFALDNAFPKLNKGFGIDLGANYDFNDKITFSASIIDFGFIKWKANPKVITQKAEFEFTGVDPANSVTGLQDLVNFDSLLTNYSEGMLDTLINLAQPKFTNESYKTRLNTKIFLGASYRPVDWLDLGVLYRGYFWERKLHSALTLSATANFWRGWSFATSYSMYNGLKNNVGLGFAYKILCFQFYGVADNIALPFFVVNDTNLSNKWIKNTKEVTFHLGMNLLFGKKQGVDYGVLD